MKPRKKQDKKCLTKMLSIRLLKEEIELLKKIGQGNLTQGIRNLISAIKNVP